jgi:hypothetical protein
MNNQDKVRAANNSSTYEAIETATWVVINNSAYARIYAKTHTIIYSAI